MGPGSASAHSAAGLVAWGRMDRGSAIALTLAVGAGFAMQAPINSALGRDIGPIPAATVSFAAGTIALFVVAVAFGVTTVAVRTLGTRAMIACLLTGQLAMAAIIDQYGLLGVNQQPLTLARSVGLVLLGAGVALVIGG